MDAAISRLIASHIVQRALIADLIDLLPHAQRDHILSRLQVEARREPGQPIAGLDPRDLDGEIQSWVGWFEHKARRDD